MGAIPLGLVIAAEVLVTASSLAILLRGPEVQLGLEAAAAARGRGRGRDTALLVFRALAAAWVFVVVLDMVFSSGLQPFVFFTVWSWVLLGLYFVLAATASVRYSRRQQGGARELCEGGASVELETASAAFASAGEGARQQDHSRLARCLQLLHCTLAPTVVLVDVTLWAVLYPADPDPTHATELQFTSYNQHALNALLFAVELSANRLPMRFRDIAAAVLWPSAYMSFTWLRVGIQAPGCLTEHTEACPVGEGSGHSVVWPYFFVDTSKPMAVVWLLGLSSAYVVFYVGMYGIRRSLRCAAEASV